MDSSRIERAYKFRLYPTPEQEGLLRRTLGCVRLVYNKALDARRTAWHEREEKIGYADTSRMLTAWKKTDDYAFLNEVSAVPLQQGLRHLQSAYMNFFNGIGAYPRYKQKRHGGSMEFTRSAFDYQWPYTLRLAKMMDTRLNVKWSRTLPKGAEPTTVTVSLDPAGRWFVSLLVRDDAVEHLPAVDRAIGIDMGLDAFAILSDGTKIENPRYGKRQCKRLRKAQRALARKQKGSCNYEKQRQRIARIHAHEADQRRDFLHKLSTRIIRENQTVCVETLNVKGLSARCKPKPDGNGGYTKNGQSRKRAMTRSIRDAAWGMFLTMLRYKAEWYGRVFQPIDRWYPSSQICSQCGHNSGRKPLNVRAWDCPNCGTHHDRDINAAMNIRVAGLAMIACGDARRSGMQRRAARAESVKQETHAARHGIPRL